MAKDRDYRFVDRKRHSQRPCGYCYSKAHKGYLTVRLLKEHGCLQKHCNCLQIYPEHPFWIERDRKRAFRAEKKRKRQEERRNGSKAKQGVGRNH